MTTLNASLPTTISQVLTLLSSDTDALSTAQQTYLTALIRTGVVAQAARAAQVEEDTIRNWRAPSHPNSATFGPAERAIREGRREYSLAAARHAWEESAAQVADRLLERATRPISTDPRHDALGARSGETILEAVGVIQRAPAVAVQVNTQALDPSALRADLSAIRAEREALSALMERRRLHNVVQSSQSALLPGAPDTQVDNKDMT